MAWACDTKRFLTGLFCTVGIAFLLLGIIIGAVLTEHVLKNSFVNRLKYEDPTTEEDCTTDNINVFFFNMTNSDDVLNGEKPNYEQVGPYNITRRSCKFEREANETKQTWRQYWDPPFVTEESVGKADDVIVNFNPAYLGTIFGLEKLGASDPEAALELNILSPFLSKAINGMRTDAFKYQVKSQGVYLGLRTLEAQATAGLINIARSVIGLEFMGALLSANQPLNFFNNESAQYGPSNILSTPLNFSASSVQSILYGPQAGWFADKTGTRNFVGFLQTNAATYKAVYGIAQTEFDALVTYAQFLYGMVPEIIYGSETTNETKKDAKLYFYQLWSNGTFLNGSTFNLGIQSFPVGTVSLTNNTVIPSGLTYEECDRLWNASNPMSFLNPTGVLAWEQAAASTSAATSLVEQFQIQQNQISLIINWIFQWDKIVEPDVILGIKTGCACNFTSLDQIPWLQWGSGNALGGASLKNFDPAFFTEPEFAFFAISIGSTTQFDITKSEELLIGPNGFLQTNNTMDFMSLYAGLASDPVNMFVLMTRWGLTSQEVLDLGEYFLYLMEDQIKPTLQGVFQMNSGLIVARSPVEWLYTANDSLLIFLGKGSPAGVLYSSSEAMTKEQARLQTPRSRNVFHGGNKTVQKESLERSDYQGQSTLSNWKEPVEVHGNYDGAQFVPGVHKEDVLDVWTSTLIRTLDFSFSAETETKEIDTWTFKLNQKWWNSSAETPELSTYYQNYKGLINITAYKAARVFFSRPHFYGVDEAIQNGVTGLDPNNEYYQDWWFNVEPESGITMRKHLPGQMSIQFTNSTEFYPQVQPGIYPIFWQDNSAIIDDDEADDFKKQVGGAKAGSLAAWIVGPAVSLIFFVMAVFFCTRVKETFAFKQEQQEMNMLELSPIEASTSSSSKTELVPKQSAKDGKQESSDSESSGTESDDSE